MVLSKSEPHSWHFETFPNLNNKVCACICGFGIGGIGRKEKQIGIIG